MSTSVFAQQLKALRLQTGLTLQQLSDRAGISISTLSKIENERISPTYERIVALADGLDVDVSSLFRDAKAPYPLSRRSVTRRGEGIKHITDQYEYEVLCADIMDKKFVPLITTVKARTKDEFPALLRHQGEEFIYVLEGQIVLHTDHYTPMVLNEGDSCYFDSTMGHVVCAAGDEQDAKIVWISSNPRIENSRTPIL